MKYKTLPVVFSAVLGIALLLSAGGNSEGALRLAYLKDRPKPNEYANPSHLRTKWNANLSVSLELACGESEGALVLLDPENANTITVKYSDKQMNNIHLQLYRVENVSLEGNILVPDPLLPVRPDAEISLNGMQLFYIKVTALSSSKPAGSKYFIKFRNENEATEGVLAVYVKVLPIRLPEGLPVTLQAGIWASERWPQAGQEKTTALKNLLAFLREYRFNGAAGALGFANKDAKGLFSFYLDDLKFRRIRLPANKMYNWKNPMSVNYPDGHPTEEDLEREYKKYLSRFDPIVRNPRWAGKLSFKIWDEPREKDYPYAVAAYRAAKKAAPELKLELSEQPEPGLKNIADVWTPHIKFLKPEDIMEQHRLGKEVWTYANRVHGIDQPLSGMRILGWLLWQFDLDGYLFWGVNWWKEDPWTAVSSWKKDSMKSGTLIYPDPQTGEIYSSLRLEYFRDGIEDMLLLRELEKTALGNTAEAATAKVLVKKLRKVYIISERYDNAPDPAKFRSEILDVLGRYR